MKKDTKVEFTEKWWAKNKAKTISDKGQLGNALKEFEAALKGAGAAKGRAKIKAVEKAVEALASVESAALKTAKAGNKIMHGDTIHVLTKTLPTAVKKHTAQIEKLSEAVKKQLGGLTLRQILKNKPLSADLMKFLKSEYSEENLEFLQIAERVQNQKVYDKYIAEGASRQVNLPSKILADFKPFIDRNAAADGPWKDAIEEIEGLISNDSLPRFHRWICEAE